MTFKAIIWTDNDRANTIKLEDLGESAGQIGRPSGPIGKTRIASTIMRNGKAGELAELLPWLLTRALGEHIYEQEKIVSLAALNPALHDSLKSVLAPILHDFVHNGNEASTFLNPAHQIAKSQNADLMAIALPLFPEALKRATWASSNFGNLACDYLDMGGNPDSLIDSLGLLLNSQADDPDGSFCRQNKEAKLAKHLCSQGFIRLLGHPRINESNKLAQLLQPYAGEIIEDDPKITPLFREDIYVLACIQGNRTGFAYAPRNEYAHYITINHLSPLKGAFINRARPEDIAETALRLFERMKNITNNSDISTPAHLAVKTLKAEFGQAICDFDERCEGFEKSDAEIRALDLK